MVEALAPQVDRVLRTGKWLAFTILWTVHRFPENRLPMGARFLNLARTVRKKLTDLGFNGLGIIAGFDIVLEENNFGSGERWWQIHLHGFIEVGAHEDQIKRKLSNAFWTPDMIRFENLSRKTVYRPTEFKPISDAVNWTGYLLKEPSRMIDKHVMVVHDQKLVRLPADMMYVDLEVQRKFLNSIRVRDRLFLQQFTLTRSGVLVRLNKPLNSNSGSQKRVRPKAKSPFIATGAEVSQRPMGSIKTRSGSHRE